MAKKRGNQEGSIYKSKDKWRAQISIEGRRLSFTGKTRQECQEWIKLMNQQIDGGLSYLGSTMKLAEFLSYWLTLIKENRRPKTFIQYKDIIEKYILPKFGNYKLKDLHPIKIEKYFTELQKSGKGDRTVQIIYSILHAALENAVKKGLIGRNPLKAVDKPKVKSSRKKTVLDPNQVQQLLIAAQGDHLETLFHLAIATGLRLGELLGLQWDDIDWVKNKLKVQRQIQRIPGKGMVFCPTKTESGNRILSLGNQTIQKLKEHYQNQQEYKQFIGSRWKENNLLFTSTIGTPLDSSNVSHHFKKILQKANLPDMRFHDLRHSSITLLLNQAGVPIKVAQARAGHTRPSTTLDIYAGDITTPLDEEAAQKMDELITPIQADLKQNCTHIARKEENPRIKEPITPYIQEMAAV